MAENDPLRQECWRRAIYCHGTATIFEQRGRILVRNLRLLTFLGIVVPASVGSVALSFGTNKAFFSYLLAVSGLVVLLQLILSVWAVSSRWSENLAYSLESGSANHRLSDRFRDLASNPPGLPVEFRQQLDLLTVEDRNWSDSDNKQGITEKEKRMGLRSGLRQFQRACEACKEIPVSMKPSKCNVCGHF